MIVRGDASVLIPCLTPVHFSLAVALATRWSSSRGFEVTEHAGPRQHDP